MVTILNGIESFNRLIQSRLLKTKNHTCDFKNISSGQRMSLIMLLTMSIFIGTTLVGFQQAHSMTQFYFNLPHKFEVSNGTLFQAAYYDNDGEGIYFIWSYTGQKDNLYDFKIQADLFSDEEKHNHTQSVKPQPELIHEDYDFKFAIDENITIGTNFELCIKSNMVEHCEWPQPVDEFGRVLGDLTSFGEPSNN